MLADKIKGLRWWIVGLIMLGTIFNYLARSSLSVAAPTLTDKLHMTTQQYSYVVAAFQGAYTVMQPVAGYILDVVGLKIGFAIFATAWAASNMMHGLATGWGSLAFFRGLLGMSEAAIFPAGMKTITQWFPAKERSVATGWLNTGTSVGAMLAPPLVVFCILQFNWQTAFVVTGGIALVWVALWLFFYRSPADHPNLSEGEREYILSGQEEGKLSSTKRPSWKQLLSTRRFWGIGIPRFLAEPAWQTFNFWIPLYLVSVRHMNLKEIALFGWLPFLAADLGCVFGGYLAPFLLRKFNTQLLTSRKLVMIVGTLFMFGPACIGLATSPYAAIGLFCLGAFGHQTISGALYTLASDVFGQHEVGTATGLSGMMGWLGGMIFSLIVGALATTIGYNPLFVCLVLFDIIGATVAWFLLKPSDYSGTLRAPKIATLAASTGR
ncbi:Hexuronate transporter [Caballeronia glathei]|jgi:ACS family hexuronate transporter-like MFS transporter|uniref:Hexuronate transporter n=1 Tax=Caballeronia glathei TaxID=60547 RepID=A0A069PBS1_9BURK|nr:MULTISPECIES: MFS transporter [Burkholderiaceae]KDR38095.1 hexuronate transporter [Caballeronia glathei]TCK36136.1 ACS family hexuronate transporter-like MFS transporter [Paraburkholderia sp. BL8N3]CDY76743.1 Hexuronate transporter [Caballeronia glathei]